jgi:aspartyl protease family protein
MTLSIVYSVSWGGKQKFSGSVETLQRGLSGHFHAKVWINGTPLKMLIDTGATKVSLSLKQAIRLGISKEQLGAIHAVQTANGTVRAADIILKQVRLGSIVAKDVDAWVILSKNEGEMALLGMSFLNRLSSWSRSGSTLSLEP